MRAARPLLTLALVLATGASLAAPAAAGPRASADRPVAERTTGPMTEPTPRALSSARRALARAEAVLEGRGGPSATLALRDLTLRRSTLTGAERARADALLRRPATSQARCTATICLHWNASDVEPGYVDAVIATVEGLQQTYVDAGYRPVKPDGSAGGNALPDIYLQDVGAEQLYGYCSPDQPPADGRYDTSAYCVLDDDFSPTQFRHGTPLQNMQVTAAHEYFHAVQFGYDVAEDGWFMEATATWAEDEVFDDVDDNVGYLGTSPLSHPARSLDQYGDGHEYGGWVFFRFLTERFDTEAGGMPTLVRDMWRRADDAPGGPKQYSLQAVASELTARGTSLGAAYAAFAVANRRPAQAYAEGAANRYPTAPLGRFSRKRGWYATKLDHLASATGRFLPKRGSRRLAVRVDMADLSRGSIALVTVVSRSGSTTTTPIRLDRSGAGRRTVPFTRAKVAAVEVTLVNASGRSQCWRSKSSPFSCMGVPVDDNQVARVKAVVRR
ncbi:MXAN_6640 family putative metalloprotease [Nocardioides sp. SYSU DS0663]|uniref:MXAN_6640 family putative metalloprotease n=1 Tax=Nocardioides sp. SYSU DS0663 TaxID=3416445 RepID=UPI003F4C4AC3